MGTARWYAVLPVATGAAVFAAGATLLLTGHSGTKGRPLGGDCGIISCSATMRPSAPGTGTPSAAPGRLMLRPARFRTGSPAPSARHPSAARGSPTPARPAASPTTSPPASPAPSPPAPVGAVTVTYTLDLRWPGGLQGQFTIVNHGSTPVRGWVLAATLPGDRIDVVWGARYRDDGTTLTLSPPGYQPSIAPGASQTAYFTASGNTARPTGCEFNGRACSG